MLKGFFLSIALLLSYASQCQFVNLNFTLTDKETMAPVSDAHIFISNASFGTTSEENGQVNLSIPKGLKEDLIISHLSYNTEVLTYGQMLRLTKNDRILLTPNGINIDEIVVTQKRSKKWKRNFERFCDAFLGKGKPSSKCKILNPEVLRFDKAKDNFKATAVDLLVIQNDYLGYKVEFLLENLTISENGSMKYSGHANFVDIADDKNQNKITKNRIETYKRSPKHFFEHLIQNDLEIGKYKIRSVSYNNGVFDELSVPKVKDLIYYDSRTNHYLLSFDEFLEVKHLGYKIIEDTNMGVRQGGLESSRFNSSQHNSSARTSYPISLLYKLTPTLIINQYGNVVNHKAVQEYGYWATQRMSQRLPLDYGIDYSDYQEIDSVEEVEKEAAPAQTKDRLSSNEQSTLSIIKDLLYSDKPRREKAFKYLNSNWEHKFLPPILDLLRINQDPWMHQEMTKILKDKIGVSTYYDGLQWMWENESEYDHIYGSVKAEIYQHIDPKFKIYFDQRDQTALIGLDEIVWGGVNQDGIPPLRNPVMIEAQGAAYLSDEDVVFGISIDGDHRAYPKRILAWHEFFVDDIANVKIAGVYCTLCGTMIAYDMTYDGKFHDLGTSGFLFNSNKLMYDKATQSLWSTIEGIPVLGPLTDQVIRLKSYPTVTTTWGKWKKMHPNSKVLSLDTGHNRNYDEGEAYKSYFANDNLMFPVAQLDGRLNNKDEVLVIKASGFQNDPLAISIDYLKKKSFYQGQISNKSIIVVSEKDGWSRAYNAGSTTFKSYKNGILRDKEGKKWEVTESFILSPNGEKLGRISAHNAFWFAWFNAYPNTRLIK